MTWLTRFLRGESPEPDGPPVYSVKFATDGWLPSKTKVQSLRWSNPDGDTLSASIDAHSTQHRLLPLWDLNALRSLYRSDAEDQGGGIVSVDVIRAGNCQ